LPDPVTSVSNEPCYTICFLHLPSQSRLDFLMRKNVILLPFPDAGRGFARFSRPGAPSRGCAFNFFNHPDHRSGPPPWSQLAVWRSSGPSTPLLFVVHALSQGKQDFFCVFLKACAMCHFFFFCFRSRASFLVAFFQRGRPNSGVPPEGFTCLLQRLSCFMPL